MLMEPKKFSVSFFDCDTFAHLRVSRLCEYFQDTSLAYLKSQGFDYLSMIEKDRFTILISRMRIKLSHLPLWGEDIFIQYWLKGFEPEKVAWGDFDVRDAQGNSIIQATSSWLLIDLKDGKARPFKEGPYRFETHPELSVLPQSIELLEPTGMPQTILTKEIKYSDIDLNSHVNNSRYADWVLDAIGMEALKERKIRSIQLNYMQQVEYNTRIALMRFPASHHHVVIFGVNEDHPEQVHFQARVGFEGSLAP